MIHSQFSYATVHQQAKESVHGGDAMAFIAVSGLLSQWSGGLIDLLAQM